MKIAIVSASQAHADVLEHMLQSEGAPETWSISLSVAGLGQLEELVEKENPDILILDGLCHKTSDLAVLERLSLQHPALGHIILSQNVSPDFLISSMRYGVHDVLEMPVAPDALRAALLRFEKKWAMSAVPRKKGKVIAFIGCKGGSGVTFLATNLGYILAEQGANVALFDLNLQFGDAVLFMSDSGSEYSLTDVTGDNITRLDASYLTACMQKILPNYAVLAAPENPEFALQIKPEHIAVLLSLARSLYDYVILDVGRVLNSVTVKALDHADMIFPVLQKTLPFIRDTKRVIHTLLELGHSKEKISLIVNRYEKDDEIALSDIEDTLGMRVYKAIPNSYKSVSASVNQGVPIIKIALNDPVSKALQEIATALTEGGERATKKSGWLSGLFNRS